VATNILMPALSPTMEEGKLAKWLVKEGDTVKSGDILAEIETDKATMEFEAVDEGKIGKLIVPAGTEGVKVNAPIAVLLGEGEKADAAPPTPKGGDIHSAMSSIKEAVSKEVGDVKAAKAEEKPAPKAEAKPVEPVKAAAPPSAQPAAPPKEEGERVFASPLAKKIAAQKGVELSSVHGSGPRGRIVKADIEAAPSFEARKERAPQDDARIDRHPEVAAKPPSKGDGLAITPLPDAKLFYKPEDYEEIPHDSMRKVIAKRLTSAKTLIPHFYLTIDCNIDGLMEIRAKLNAQSPKENGFKLSVNDFVVKASALSLMRVPAVNASWTENSMLRHKHADIGIAVALDFGLITPIVFRAEEKGLAVISNEVKSLAERAKTKKLKPQEYEGGGFSISNLGMFGIKDFAAVINPPHGCILAVGAGEPRAVVKNGALAIANVMSCTIACDHRVVDGATGARWMQAFKKIIEAPAMLAL
jgi:pyruvate dehydrogenase E2 component (dihydrolipoamide acetyltransferase)